MLKHIKRLLKDEAAPTAVEYALMVAAVAVIVIAVVWLLGGNVNDTFNPDGTSIGGA